jgi:hypothetical protein
MRWFKCGNIGDQAMQIRRINAALAVTSTEALHTDLLRELLLVSLDLLKIIIQLITSDPLVHLLQDNRLWDAQHKSGL